MDEADSAAAPMDSPFGTPGTTPSPAGDAGTAIDSDAAANMATGELSANDASRFLAQAGFGGTDDEIARVQQLGYAEWLNAELARPASGSRYNWLTQQGYKTEEFRNVGPQALDRALWRRMILADDVLRQRMTLALSELFVISPPQLDSAGGFKQFGGAAYMDMLDAQAFGSYRELLGAVTKSLQMGSFLSMRGSRGADGSGTAPDENYAREVLQLFSIGLVDLGLDGNPQLDANGQPVESYTQEDVAGLAAVFTGWDDSEPEPFSSSPDHWTRPMNFFPEYHASEEKRFLGITIPAGTDGATSLEVALDLIADHPNVPGFISRQLIQRLVTSNPSSEYVSRVARVFLNDGNGQRGQLGAVLKAILLDQEARVRPAGSQAEIFGKVREPMIRFTQWARTFRLRGEDDSWDMYNISRPSTQLGQSPLDAPSVFNYFRPGYTPPNSALAEQQLVAPELQITTESSVVGYANFMTRIIRSGLNNLTPNYSRELPLAGEPVELIARLDTLLTGGTLSAATRGLIVSTLEAMKVESEEQRLDRIRAAILLIMISSDYLVQR